MDAPPGRSWLRERTDKPSWRTQPAENALCTVRRSGEEGQ